MYVEDSRSVCQPEVYPGGLGMDTGKDGRRSNANTGHGSVSGVMGPWRRTACKRVLQAGVG